MSGEGENRQQAPSSFYHQHDGTNPTLGVSAGDDDYNDIETASRASRYSRHRRRQNQYDNHNNDDNVSVITATQSVISKTAASIVSKVTATTKKQQAAITTANASLKEPLHVDNGESLSEASTAQGSVAAVDPYTIFQKDLQNQLHTLDEAMNEYIRISTSSIDQQQAYHAEYKQCKKHVKHCIKVAIQTKQDIDTTITFMKKQQSDAETTDCYKRTAFVRTSNDHIQSIQKQFLCIDTEYKQKHKIKKKHSVDNKIKTRSNVDDGVSSSASINSARKQKPSPPEVTGKNGEQQQQQQVLQQQDETIHGLSAAVTRVRYMASHIQEEIVSQNKILDEMDDDMTNVESELGVVLGKVAKLLQTKNTFMIGTIVSLSVIVVVLFFIILYF